MISPAALVSTGIILLTVIAIAYGGVFLLRVSTGGVPVNDLQRSFYRAGHAHAGVLVILGLVVRLWVELGGVAEPWAGLSSCVLWSAILMPAGFFLSVVGRDPQRPSRLVWLLWAGAGLLLVGLVTAAVGLLQAGLR